MSPVVPIRQRTVEVQSPQVRPAPQISPANVGSVVAGQFGEDIAKAQVDFGASAVKLTAQHMERIAQQQYHSNVAIGEDAGNKLDDFARDVSYNKDFTKTTVKDALGNESEIDLPNGLLNRQNYSAKGVSDGFAKALETRRAADETALKDNPVARMKYLERYESIKKTYMETLLKHEISEVRNGDKNLMAESTMKDLARIALADEPERQNIIKSIDSRYAGAVSSGLITYDQAKNERDEARYNVFLLDAKRDKDLAKQRVDSGYYGFDGERTDTALSTLQHYKELDDKAVVLDNISGRFDYILKVSQGMERLNPDDDVLAYASKDPVLAEAIKTASSDMFIPEVLDKEFADVVKTISEAKDQDTLSKYLLNVVTAAKSEKSQERLPILIYYAAQRAKTLGLTKDWADEVMKDPAQAAIDAGVHSIMRKIDTPVERNQATADYLNLVNNKKMPKEAYDTAMRNSMIRQYPEIATMDNPPTMIVDKNTPARYVFSKGKFSPDRAWNPKTQKFEVVKKVETK